VGRFHRRRAERRREQLTVTRNAIGAGCSAGTEARLEKHDAACGQLAAPQEEEHGNLLLEAFGDDQLLLNEPAQRMTTKLGWREFSSYGLHDPRASGEAAQRRQA
jgi:hypothetical protein